MYDVDAVRAHFPALSDGLARFDGPGGSLVPDVVADAVRDALVSGMCQRDPSAEPGRRTDRTVLDARAAMGRFLGTDPRGVVFGRSMTALTFDLARTMSREWGPGDEVVVSRLDHDANVRPWVIAAERAGATVRWLEFDVDTTEPHDVGPLLSDRTRVVAVTGASNLVGTRPDVAAIAAQAHEAGALVAVDAVHLAAHAPVDRVALGADVVTCSPYKFCGPHLGVLAADPALLETLRPDKLEPAPEAVPDRFEVGTLSWELLAGVTAAVGFLADLGGTAAVDEHEQPLLQHLLEGLAAIPAITTYGRARHRTPTVLLRRDGEPPAATSARLAEADVVAPASTFYAVEPARRLGIAPEGGVRVGLAPYTSADDVDRLLAALR